MAAPYGVPAASAGDMVARPPDLIVTGVPPESAAKSSGAVIAEPDVVQVVLSSSATNASLKALVTRDGYSSRQEAEVERDAGRRAERLPDSEDC